MPDDYPEDIPVTCDEQAQKAVDCYEVGASVLHIHIPAPRLNAPPDCLPPVGGRSVLVG